MERNGTSERKDANAGWKWQGMLSGDLSINTGEKECLGKAEHGILDINAVWPLTGLFSDCVVQDIFKRRIARRWGPCGSL